MIELLDNPGEDPAGLIVLEHERNHRDSWSLAGSFRLGNSCESSWPLALPPARGGAAAHHVQDRRGAETHREAGRLDGKE